MDENFDSLQLRSHFLSATQVPMLAVDRAGRIVDINDAVIHASRMPREQWTGSDFVAHFIDRPAAGRLLQRALTEGNVVSETLRTQHGDGSPAELELHMEPIRNDAREVIGLFVEARDVTDVKQVQCKLIAASHYARSLIEASIDPLVTISTGGKIMDVNRATEQATGRPREALIGSDFSDYFTEPAKARAGYQRVFSQGHVTDYPLALCHTSGTVIDVLYNASIYHDEAGQVAGVFAAARDVTALKRSQEALETTNREVVLLGQTNSLLQSSRTVEESYPIIRATMEQLFPASSGRLFLLRASGNLLEEAVCWGAQCTEELSIPPGDCWALRRSHIHEIGFEKSINPPCRYIDPETKPYMCIPLQAQGTALGIIHLVIDPAGTDANRRQHFRQLAGAAADNISLALANLRLRESLHSLSIRDPLTGLYNRRFMEEALAREISRMTRARKPLALAMLDIDNFKHFNDAYGHEAGDMVLKEFAQLMSRFRQGSDLACRYGGEEFLLILPELEPEQACARLEKFRDSVSHLSVMLHGKALPGITVSIGVACLPGHGTHGESLIKAADDALYRAKANGRNRTELADVGKS
ncbi:MAG: diguanylate cyclase [Thauera sp.]|nr:diguanylate cyclase [Thauera sp.]